MDIALLPSVPAATATAAAGAATGKPDGSPAAVPFVSPPLQQDQHESCMQHDVSSPTRDEMAATAGRKYVRSLIDIIDGHGTHVASMLSAIDELRHTRETRHTETAAVLLAQTRACTEAQQECSELRLRLQEAQERSIRLLHENTVLHSQFAEQKIKVEALMELCRTRGYVPGIGSRSGKKGEQLQQQRGLARGDTPGGTIKSPVLLSIRAAAAAASRETKVRDAGLFAETGELLRTVLPRTPPAQPLSATAATRSPRSSNMAAASHTPVWQRRLQDDEAREGSVEEDGDVMDEADMDIQSALRAAAESDAAQACREQLLLALTRESQALREQLDEQRGAYELERARRLDEENTRHAAALASQKASMTTIHHLEEMSECSLRELITYRHKTDQQLRDARGKIDWLKAGLDEALRSVEEYRRKAAAAPRLLGVQQRHAGRTASGVRSWRGGGGAAACARARAAGASPPADYGTCVDDQRRRGGSSSQKQPQQHNAGSNMHINSGAGGASAPFSTNRNEMDGVASYDLNEVYATYTTLPNTSPVVVSPAVATAGGTMTTAATLLSAATASALAERKRTEKALIERDDRIESLQQELKQQQQQRRRAEERHRLEMSGVRSEVDLMRQSLRSMEKRVYFSRAREEAAVEAENALVDAYYY